MHLQVQINDGNARHVLCMSFRCGVACDEELVEQVMKVSSLCGLLWGRAGSSGLSVCIPAEVPGSCRQLEMSGYL
jgi:hypothetical protein